MADTQVETGYDRHDPNTRFIALLGLVTIVVLIAAVFGVQYYYDRMYDEQVYVKEMEPKSEALEDLRAREDEQLHSYQYIDREKGTVRIPIERAMELLVKEAK
jgi:hypothetical protein